MMFRFVVPIFLFLGVGLLDGKPYFLDLNKGKSNLASVSKVVSISQTDLVCLKGGIRQGFQNGVTAFVLNQQSEKIATLVVVCSNRHSSVALIIDKSHEENISNGDSVEIKPR